MGKMAGIGGSAALALLLGGCSAGADETAQSGSSASIEGAGTETLSAPSGQVNDWNCKPTAAHPEPVVLAHGLGANGDDNWFFHGPQIAGAGYCVFSTTYGAGILGPLVGGIGPMEDSAAQLGAFVDEVLAATGASQVDVVGHSEGTTVPAYYFKFLGGAAKVKRFVGFGANYQGTSLHGLSTLIGLLTSSAPGLADLFSRDACAACLEFMPGSPFNQKLAAGGVAVAGPSYTNIVSRNDNVVTPYTSGVIDAPNVTNIVLQDACPLDISGHLSLAIDPNVTQLVLRALDPDHAKRLQCQPFFSGF